MGKVYDLAKQEISEIENEVQKDLDKFSGGGIRFKIDITSEKTLELIFTRQYIDWLNYDSQTIYCTDARVITGTIHRDYPSDCVNRKLRDFSRSFFIYVLTL